MCRSGNFPESRDYSRRRDAPKGRSGQGITQYDPPLSPAKNIQTDGYPTRAYRRPLERVLVPFVAT
jgi:hypothetical protein